MICRLFANLGSSCGSMPTQPIRPSGVKNLMSSIFDGLHAKRVASLANAAFGALVAAQLAVATIGRALAMATSRNPKHAIKQVDRFFSNAGVDVWELFASWVPFVVGPRPEIMVALDMDRLRQGQPVHDRALPRDQARPCHTAALEDGNQVRAEGLAQ